MSNQIITTLIDGGNIIGKVSGVTYARVQAKIEALEAGVAETDQRIDNLVTTPVPTGEIIAEEIIDARDGEVSVGAKIRSVDALLADIPTQIDLSVANQYNQFNASAPVPTVVFTFDDGQIQDYTVMKPLFESYGYKATSFIVTGRIGLENYMTTDQLKELHQAGFEIASHSISHPAMATMTEAQIENELVNSKLTLNKLGFPANNFAFPNGSVSYLAKRLTRKYYKSASLYNGNVKINTIPISNTEVSRVALGSWFDGPDLNTCTGYYKLKIDEAISKNGLCVFAIHPYAMRDDAAQMGYLVDTLNYCQSIGISVKTLDDALNSFGYAMDLTAFNPTTNVPVNYFKIGADGLMYSNTVATSAIVPLNKFNANTTYDKYPAQLSIMSITNPASAGFPYNNCYVYTDRTFVYQDEVRQWCYEKYGSRMKYRTTDATGAWGKWIEYEKRIEFVGLRRPYVYKGATSTVTIVAGGRNDELLIDPTVAKSNTIVVTPTKPLPKGIVISTYINDAQQARLIVDNVTNASISFIVSDFEMNVLVLE